MRISSILVTIILLMNVAGYYPVFLIQQAEIRREIKWRIKNSVAEEDLHLITVHDAIELEWLREGKEFRHQGQLFDVVRTEKKDGLIHYHCINDHQESQLFASLDELVRKRLNAEEMPEQNEDTGHHRPLKRLVKIFSSLHYLPVENFVLGYSLQAKNAFGTAPDNYTSPFFACDYPPPRFLV